MRQFIIAGNWKMNAPALEEFATALAAALYARPQSVRCVISPPYPFIPAAATMLGTEIAAQDVSEHDSGAFTGEVSAEILKNSGATLALVGHSERRLYHNESDELINRKALAALRGGLAPIICVGETLEERQAGKTREVLIQRTQRAIDGLSAEDLSRVIFAYEPVWAIGTGMAATPTDAAIGAEAIFDASGLIASAGCPILYGGSVTVENAESLLRVTAINGLLIGGTSLNAAALSEVLRIASAIAGEETA